MDNIDINNIEKKINYVFNNKQNLMLALTHSSYANEKKAEGLLSNERIEFLGDSVLNLAISEMIYRRYPDLSEGEMTRARANIVCEQSLLTCSNKINIGHYLLLGKGEELTGGRKRSSILSDAFEALIGAIYIDGGIEKSKEFIYNQMGEIIETSIKGDMLFDYKTQFQENVQKNNDKRIIYNIIKEVGPDHNKIFISEVSLDDQVMGIGEGRSKKEAEQMAAKSALKKIQ